MSSKYQRTPNTSLFVRNIHDDTRCVLVHFRVNILKFSEIFMFVQLNQLGPKVRPTVKLRESISYLENFPDAIFCVLNWK